MRKSFDGGEHMATARTKVYREKLARSVAGIAPVPLVTHVAVGTGGVNQDGSPKPLTGEEKGLFNEVLRKAVTPSLYNKTTVRCSVSVLADADGVVGVGINEIGIFDSDGDLVAIKTTTSKNLEATDQLEFDIDAIF